MIIIVYTSQVAASQAHLSQQASNATDTYMKVQETWGWGVLKMGKSGPVREDGLFFIIMTKNEIKTLKQPI